MKIMIDASDLERFGIPQPDTAIPASEGNQGLRQCVSPCKQLIALFASVERLEDIVFRIQREVAGMECLLAGLEARR